MSVALFWQLLKQTGQAWLGDNAARLGAALAFYSVLSLSPLLVLILAAASVLWGAQAAQGQMMNQIGGLVGPQAAQAIQTVLAASADAPHSGRVAATIGVCSLLFSASGAFGELQAAMNIIWHVDTKADRPLPLLIKERIFSFAMVAGSGFLLLLSLLVSAALAAASHIVNGFLPQGLIVMDAVNIVAGSAIVCLLFALIFKTVPDLAVPWRGVWPGAILTAALFIAGKYLIGLYLGHAGIGSSYGAAGSLVILLVWIYYSAQILFFGAEFAYVYCRHYRLIQNDQIQ